MKTQSYTLETCPDREKHTKCPTSYVEWHYWADEMKATHRAKKCKTCDLFAIWVPKTRK